MKKLAYLFFIIPLFLISCVTPPVPDVEQAIQDADSDTLIPLSNNRTQGYFNTALPIESSPTRGLIHSYIGSIGDGVGVGSRADIEYLERSMHRIATEHFDPDEHFFRDGLILQREFVSNILRPADADDDDNIGLNPAIGSEINFNGEMLESGEDRVSQIRPLAYVLEQNFGTIVDGEFQLEGVSVSLAINPHHTISDQSRGTITNYRMTDEQILSIGQEMAAELLPLLRSVYPELRDVPIIFGLFILEAGHSVIPGRLASTSVAEVGSSSLSSWTAVDERHFLLEKANTDITEYDVNINEEFIHFRESISAQFPHVYGIVGRVHFVDRQVYQVSIVFNMQFFGLSEKLSFHQMIGQYVNEFSPEYDIRIVIRSTDEIHGAVTRPPHGEPEITWISW